jgi:hypothetical protein
MSHSFHLRADVHPVFVGDDLVMLDVSADRYICLADAAAGLALDPARDRLIVQDPALVDDLAGAGLARAENGRVCARPDLPRLPQRSALAEAYAPPKTRDAREAVVALVDVARCYRGRTFSQIVQAASRPRTSAPRITPALETAVTRFHGWAPYAPVSGKCLLRSFMLLRTLRRQGLDALWVFGVRTWPFHAHCWLQCEDTVLDDPAERIWAYTPIMVV